MAAAVMSAMALADGVNRLLDGVMDGDPFQVTLGIGEMAAGAAGLRASTAGLAKASEVTVYRAFGGDSRAQGWSWTPVNPQTVRNFRDVAGLPSGGESGFTNTADFVIKGRVKLSNIIDSRPALPLDGNRGGAT
jgi:hypothetical protein